MKCNFRPSKVAFLDFETQSSAKLVTASQYAKDPSTRALTCCVKVDGKMHRLGPYLNDEDKALLARIARDNVLVAHNAPFDAAIWEHALGLPEATWYDTLPPSRAAGFPGKLDAISRIVTGRGKDPMGKQLIDMLCIIRNGKVPAVGPAHGLLMNYCQQDVEELEAIYERVKGYGEPELMRVDRCINQRGVPMSRSYLEAMSEVYASNKLQSEERFKEITGGKNARSSKQVAEWLQSKGFAVDSVNKNALRELEADPEKFFEGADGDCELNDALVELVSEMIANRQELVKVGGGKVAAGLAGLEEDGRIRDQFVVYGAGPGRWSGRDMQFHNMPLAVQDLFVRDEWPTLDRVQALAAQASEKLKKRVGNADVANSMLRHAVRSEDDSDLFVADYNAVEARCLAWLAEARSMLAIYNDPLGASIYLDMGRKVYGRTIRKTDVQEYALAKALVLGCGYGMSAKKFELSLVKRSKGAFDAIKASGMDSKKLVALYRESYPEIPKFWYALGHAVLECVKYLDYRRVGRIGMHMQGPDLHVVLPSGRPIVYRNAAVGSIVPKYQRLFMDPSEHYEVTTVLYDHPRGYRADLYGSKLCENVCQASCRDLLAEALVNFESVQLDPFLHVHDEGACKEQRRRFPEFMEIMSARPWWADDFPILAEGYCGKIWTKTPKGYDCRDYFCGKELKR